MGVNLSKSAIERVLLATPWVFGWQLRESLEKKLNGEHLRNTATSFISRLMQY